MSVTQAPPDVRDEAERPFLRDLGGEFARVLRTRPDWLYGMVCSWVLGLGTFAFLALFTSPDWNSPMSTIVVPVVLTAIADGSLTNQLAAEPDWTARRLREGADPGRLLSVRNVFLLFWELVFIALLVFAVARIGHQTTWILPALPQLAVLPLASIAIGNLASVLVPCPFARMSKRLQAVGTWARWSIYVAIPFALSSIAGALWALPTLLEDRWEGPVIQRVTHLKHHAVTVTHVTDVYLIVWLVVIPLWHLTIWLISLRLSSALARARRHGLARLMDRHAELCDTLPDLSLVGAARQLPTRIKEIPADLRAEVKLISSEIMEATTTLSRL